MSRSRTHFKGWGFDYGGRRPGNKGYMASPCPHKGTKKRTHRLERRVIGKAIVKLALDGNA